MISDILSYHRKVIHSNIEPLIRESGGEARNVIALLEKRGESKDIFGSLEAGLLFASDICFLAATGNEKYRALAVEVSDTVCRRYFNPRGTFFQHDRNSWFKPSEMWATIPWGVAFQGNRMFSLYHDLQNDLPAESRDWWRESLGKMAGWIYSNPLIGSCVFNCVIDLCGLLWGIGRELKNECWTAWALEAAHERIRRDVDEEGFIQGENGGCSGTYQLIGARFLARFAWESRDPMLLAANDQITNAQLAFSSPTLLWPGNFGTRSATLDRLDCTNIFPTYGNGENLLLAAVQGNRVAAHFVKQFGQAHWSRDLELWRAALETPACVPECLPVRRFRGVESVKITGGDFVAWFCNYNRSIWARGFCNLWHAGIDDMIFSTLHSLPSEVEKSKLHLGDTSDWAGFPHVRVTNGGNVYDSQQRIHDLAVTEHDGVTVAWDESLCDAVGDKGGEMRSTYRFAGSRIEMKIELRDLVGAVTLDFHVMKRLESYGGLWWGEDIDAMERGCLPRSGGWFHDRKFVPGEATKFGVQLDNAVFVFEAISLPEGAVIQLGLLRENGLHTNNLGGFRLRIELSRDTTEADDLELTFHTIKPKDNCFA